MRDTDGSGSVLRPTGPFVGEGCGRKRASLESGPEPRLDDDLVEAIVARLRDEGAPAGTWLVRIAQVRQSLQAADDLLLELYDAILNQLPPL